MKLSISYKHVESHKPVEVEVERRVGKLGKLLQSYSPDLAGRHVARHRDGGQRQNKLQESLRRIGSAGEKASG